MAMMLASVVVFVAWIAAAALLAVVFFGWTESLLVSVPTAVCVATVAALLLVRPKGR